jgi:hypothetical protein
MVYFGLTPACIDVWPAIKNSLPKSVAKLPNFGVANGISFKKAGYDAEPKNIPAK